MLDAPATGTVLAAGGQTVVTGASGLSDDLPAGDLDVFSEPAGGWSGTIEPAAVLHASDGAGLVGALVSGNTIAAVSPSAVYIFVAPAGGWAGTVAQVARIPISPGQPAAGRPTVELSGDTLTIAGQWIAADHGRGDQELPIYVLRRPATGWQTVSAPTPRTYITTGDGISEPFVGVANSGGTVEIASLHVVDGLDHNCPCTALLWAINGFGAKASAPLASPITAAASLSDPADFQLAADGDTLLIGAPGGVHLYTIEPSARVRVTHPVLTGLVGAASPRLSLALRARPGAGLIRSVSLTLPTGLSISRSAHVRGRGVTATGSKVSTAISKTRTLIIRLTRPRAQTTIAITHGALIEQRSLRSTLKQIKTGGGHRNAKLLLQTTNTNGGSTRTQLRFTIRR